MTQKIIADEKPVCIYISAFDVCETVFFRTAPRAIANLKSNVQIDMNLLHWGSFSRFFSFEITSKIYSFPGTQIQIPIQPIHFEENAAVNMKKCSWNSINDEEKFHMETLHSLSEIRWHMRKIVKERIRVNEEIVSCARNTSFISWLGYMLEYEFECNPLHRLMNESFSFEKLYEIFDTGKN